jgi:23S rRNA pseudouridine2605 synthase
MRLARVSFAGITAEGLRPGQWRLLTREELADLKKTYGVPKSITSQERAVAEHGRGPQTQSAQGARRGAAGRDARARGAEARPARGGDAKKPAARKEPVVEYQSGPRYGGGAPGRRSYDTREDGGGGAGRGSSGGRYPDRQGEPRTSEPPGRGGRTRTTGTSGGIGSRGDAGRVKGRRG